MRVLTFVALLALGTTCAPGFSSILEPLTAIFAPDETDTRQGMDPNGQPTADTRQGMDPNGAV